MCCLFGLLDPRLRFTGAQKTRMLHALATAAEARGTDASGIAYNDPAAHTLRVIKAPVPGRRLRFHIPSGALAVMGHTRLTTQGDAKKNRNNHPFTGRVGGTRFAFAHNGMLYNDQELRQQFALPETGIETDSYAAVQLLEQQGSLEFDSLRFVAEQLEGSFTFTVLDSKDNLFIIRGDNPLFLLHFPKSGLYLYASTREIVYKALEMLSQPAKEGTSVNIRCGEMLKIDRAGMVTRASFDDSRLRICMPYYYPAVRMPHRQPVSYLDELKSVAFAFGYSPAMIDRLIARGITPEEIEEYLYEI